MLLSLLCLHILLARLLTPLVSYDMAIYVFHCVSTTLFC